MKEIYHGTLIKKIRESKKMTQEYLSAGIITRTYLSKIENNQSFPSFYTLNCLLQRMDISFDEFYYLLNGKKNSEKDAIINHFFSITSNKSKSELYKCVTNCINYLRTTKDITIMDIQNICIGLLKLSEKKSLKEVSPEIFNVWRRLQNHDQWFFLEIRLINCILFMFPIDTSLLIGQRLKKELDSYNKYQNSVDYIGIIYLNISTIFLEANHYKDALETLVFIVNHESIKKRFDLYCFASARIAILNGDEKNYLKYITILEMLSEYDYLIIELNKEKDKYQCKDV